MRHRTTQQHTDWWAKRKIDWRKDYLSTWNHPHRFLISALLRELPWFSLMEIGVGAGANLVNIVKCLPDKQLGGIDVSEDAIKTAGEVLKGGFFKVGTVQDIPMSDNSSDVVLTDAMLIYVDPFKIDKSIEEIKRVARKYVVFCEFHNTNWWHRLKLLYTSGYHSHNYKKLLEKHGFYDIQIIKIPDGVWSDTHWEKEGYLITAVVPKRK